MLAVAVEHRAVLELEIARHHGFDHAGLLEQLHAAGEQAFADGEAREFLALEHQHRDTRGARATRRRWSRPGRRR